MTTPEFKIQMIKEGRSAELLAQIDAAIASEPNNASHHADKAFVCSRLKDRNGAVANALRASELAPEEPAYSFEASIQLAKDGRLQEAETHATRSIDSSIDASSSYYLGTAYLLRAYYRARMGRKADALADLAFVHDDATFYVDRIISKQHVREL